MNPLRNWTGEGDQEIRFFKNEWLCLTLIFYRKVPSKIKVRVF